MSNKLIVKHRQAGGTGAGAPGVIGAMNGEIAINFDTGANTPELWAFTTGGWRRLNPAAAAPTIGNVSLPGGSIGSATGIGTAWTALAIKPTDPIIIAAYGGVAYIKTGNGAADGDWTSLGSATAFATAADILAGTDTTKSINAKSLRDYTVVAPDATPANDANHIVRLNATGKIDAGFLTISPITYAGNYDISSTAPSTMPPAGSFGTVNVTGATSAGTTPSVSWQAKISSGAAKLENGDLLISDGTTFHPVSMAADLSAYLPLAGGSMTNTAVVTMNVATGSAPTNPLVRLDGSDAAKSAIDNFTIDCGLF
jgi:hypothetical protein